MTDPGMTRNEAITKAIEAALQADRATDPDFIKGFARTAQAWSEIAALLPPDESDVISVKHKGTLSAQDARPCGHGVIAWRTGDHWVHPVSMSECDNPPVTE